MYRYVKSKLNEAGEIMVMLSNGTKFELHLHNTRFDDKAHLIEINTGVELYWINGDEIIYSWIHREKN